MGGEGKTEKETRDVQRMISRRIKVPVEKLQLYIILSERTRVVVVYKRKIYKTRKWEAGREKKNEELISVLLNFCCYNDSVESLTMQK